MKKRKVKRKVYFFLLKPQENEDGTKRNFHIKKALKAIKSLEFGSGTGCESRYMANSDDADIAVWPDTASAIPRLSIGHSRKAGLPSIETRGEVAPLAIKRHERLLERSHVCFFDNGIVGAEYNHYAPRATKLRDYFSEKLPKFPKVDLIALTNNDTKKVIDGMEDIRLLRMKVHKNQLDLLDMANISIADSLAAGEQQFGVEYFELILQAPRRETLRGAIMSTIKSLIGKSNHLAHFETLQVKGRSAETKTVEVFDLLKDKFVSQRTIERVDDRHGAVDEDRMYMEIESAYNSLKDQLERAAGLKL